MHKVLVFLQMLFAVVEVAAWDPDAGLIRPMTFHKDVTVTSNPDEKQNIVDGDAASHWQSGATLPTGWISRYSHSFRIKLKKITR